MRLPREPNTIETLNFAGLMAIWSFGEMYIYAAILAGQSHGQSRGRRLIVACKHLYFI